MNTVVAIDGPAASGKSTVARRLAQALGFVYVDTGAMYRAYAWLALERHADPSDRAAVRALIETGGFRTLVENGAVSLRLAGTDPAPHIRSDAVNRTVSPIAAVPELREHLVIEQRKLRLDHCLVVEGRDIGTVVFTDTPHKYFIDADPGERHRRRQAQGQSDALAARDAQDRSRAAAPLLRAADSKLIDSTHAPADQIVRDILADLRASGLSTASL